MSQLIDRIECATNARWWLLLLLVLVSLPAPVLAFVIVSAIWLLTWADTERYFAEFGR